MGRGAGNAVTQPGSDFLAATQVTVGATDTLVALARAGRGSITITNLGTTAVYVGIAGVVVATGDLLPGTVGASKTYLVGCEIHAIAASGTQAVSVSEEYDA